MDDKQLITILNRISCGDTHAFDDLYKDYFKLMFGVAMSVLKNEDNSYDVVQNIVVKLYTLHPEKFPQTSAMSWLYSVSKNEALQFLRKEHVTFPISEAALIIPVEKSEIDALIDLESYYSHISTLNPQEREIVTLKVISGLKYREIAKLLNIPMGTVQWRYNCAIHKLQIFMTNLSMFLVSFAGSVWSAYNYFKNFNEPVAGGPDEAIGEISICWLILFIVATCIFAFLTFAFHRKYFKRQKTSYHPHRNCKERRRHIGG